MPPTSRRPAALVVLLVTALTALVVAISGLTLAGSAEAGPVQRGTLSVTNSSVPAGGSIALYGKIRKKADRAVKVQQRVGSRWVTVAGGRTDKRGRFSIGVTTPGEPGTVSYRALVPKYALIRSRESAGRKYASTVTAPVTVVLTSPTTSGPSPSPSPSPTTGPLLPVPSLPSIPGLPGLPL